MYLFLLNYPKYIKPIINLKKEKENKDLKFNTFINYEKVVKKFNHAILKNKKIIEVKNSVLNASKVNFADLTEGILYSYKDTYYFAPDNINDKYGEKINDFKILGQNFIKIKKNQKFDKLGSTMFGSDIYLKIKNLGYCERQNITYKMRLGILYRLYDILEYGGSFYTAIMDYCDIKEIEYVYLLSLLFENLIFIGGGHVQCYNYLGEGRISKKEFKKILEDSFYIHPKPHLNLLINYLKESFENKIKDMNMLMKYKYQKYIDISFEFILSSIMETSVDSSILKNIENNFRRDFDIQKNTEWMIQLIYKTKKNTVQQIINILNLFDIKMTNFKYLQIGMSYGAFSKLILENSRPEAFLTIIDKEQKSIWENDGFNYLTQNGFKNFECLYEDTFYALPQLLKLYHPLSFSFIFIEKPLPFDYMINLLVYINSLLGRFGVLMFDKMMNINMFKVYDFIDKNYKHFKKIENKDDIMIYIKNDEDIRTPFDFIF